MMVDLLTLSTIDKVTDGSSEQSGDSSCAGYDAGIPKSVPTSPEPAGTPNMGHPYFLPIKFWIPHSPNMGHPPKKPEKIVPTSPDITVSHSPLSVRLL